MKKMTEEAFAEGLRILSSPIDTLSNADIETRIRLLKEETEHQSLILAQNAAELCAQNDNQPN